MEITEILLYRDVTEIVSIDEYMDMKPNVSGSYRNRSVGLFAIERNL